MEEIYNIFTFLDENDICQQLGYTKHRVDFSTDDIKYEYLCNHVDSDISRCESHSLVNPVRKSTDDAYCRLHGVSILLHKAFEVFNIPNTSLYVITHVKNGKAIVDLRIAASEDTLNNRRKLMGYEGDQIDWLTHYRKEGVIDISSLIDDDFYKAIKLTFQNGHYLSSMKLLMSCMDSLAFIEYGVGKQSVFIKWLDEYADLSSVQITAEELWEFRNGILHMSNLNSRKILQGKVRRISFYVSNDPLEFYFERSGIHFFNFRKLIHCHAEGIQKWGDSYNCDPDKFILFIERYDEMVSDYRMLNRKNNFKT